MGHRNLDLYYRDWANHPDIGHVAQRMLAYMLHRAADGGNPPVYFGGWEQLAVAAGITRGSAGVNTVKASVRRALRELKNAGLIVSSEQAGPGVRENYALVLDPRKSFVPEGQGRNITWREVNKPMHQVDEDTPRISTLDTPRISNGYTPRISGGDTPDDAMAIQDAPERRYKATLPKEDQTNSKESSKRDGKTKSSQAVVLRGETIRFAATDLDEFLKNEDPQLLWPKDHTLSHEQQAQYDTASKQLQGIPNLGRDEMDYVSQVWPAVVNTYQRVIFASALTTAKQLQSTGTDDGLW